MPMFNVLVSFVLMMAIFLVADWAVEDPTAIGDLVSFISYMMLIMFSLMMSALVIMTASRAKVSFKRINEIFEKKVEKTYGEKKIDVLNEIEFKNVSYKFKNDEEKFLEDLSFKIKTHETVGIIGATGSGKSTMVHLFSRLYDVSSGQILFDGVDVKEIEKSELDNKIAIVLQKPILLSGSIKDNIKQGKKNATNEEVVKAAKMAQAFEFIDKYEEKFDSILYQRGSNLSGGQKQRISIARGLVKSPKLLILDDATSALDARSENLVRKDLDNNNDISIKVIVSQKISTIINANKIIVLKDGKIESIGTHEELIESSNEYMKIYETQKGV